MDAVVVAAVGLLLGFCTVDVLRGGAAFTVDCCLVPGRRTLIALQKRCAAIAYLGAQSLAVAAKRLDDLSRSPVRESSSNADLAPPWGDLSQLRTSIVSVVGLVD